MSVMSELVLREATASDAGAIAGILRAQAIFVHIDAEAPEETKVRLEERIRASVPSHDLILVALVDGSIVGYGAVRWMQNLILRGIDGYLSELFLHPDAVGKQIGTRLLNAFRDAAKTRNAERLWCINLRDRDSYKRAFYRKSGWDERDIAVFMERQPPSR
jgi:GNAT superfamily N-acetyltransferase